MGIVSDRLVAGTARITVIHNVGPGTREENFLAAYPQTGHFRLSGVF